ncbi:hypothetical protein NDU88_002349 [Pleurodeles waltl]|uniref:Uncharacterized protein n=1 Tax=Pleurodeles waltl TaxID=8319 RepID=A0AAV7W2R9_PLEWA|nr:hypothetical protein NDU88_002349 [Pleurodeles waltl]
MEGAESQSKIVDLLISSPQLFVEAGLPADGGGFCGGAWPAADEAARLARRSDSREWGPAIPVAKKAQSGAHDNTSTSRRIIAPAGTKPTKTERQRGRNQRFAPRPLESKMAAASQRQSDGALLSEVSA